MCEVTSSSEADTKNIFKGSDFLFIIAHILVIQLYTNMLLKFVYICILKISIHKYLNSVWTNDAGLEQHMDMLI